MMFKNHIKVFVQVDDDLKPIETDGGVKFVYQLKEDAPSYSAKLANLSYIDGAEAVDAEVNVSQAAKKPQATKEKKELLDPPDRPTQSVDTIPPGTIIIYTDGGASPNPGPAGLGIVMLFGQHMLEIWEFFPHATNNYCELTAILHALQHVKNKALPVILYTDSAYSIGVCTGSMRAKQNVELIQEIQVEMSKFSHLQLQKVRAHVGIKYNEHVDQLCQLARDTRSSGERRN